MAIRKGGSYVITAEGKLKRREVSEEKPKSKEQAPRNRHDAAAHKRGKTQ